MSIWLHWNVFTVARLLLWIARMEMDWNLKQWASFSKFSSCVLKKSQKELGRFALPARLHLISNLLRNSVGAFSCVWVKVKHGAIPHNRGWGVQLVNHKSVLFEMNQSKPLQTGVCLMSILCKWPTSSKGHANGLWLVDFDPSCLFSSSKDGWRKKSVMDDTERILRFYTVNFWLNS